MAESQESKSGKFLQDELVSKIVKDANQPPDALLLTGYIGQSSEAGHIRLYLDAQFGDYVEIPEDAVLHALEIPKQSSPLGGSYVWIKRDATVVHGKVGGDRPKSKYLEGRIQQDFSRAGPAPDAPHIPPPSAPIICRTGDDPCPPQTHLCTHQPQCVTAFCTIPPQCHPTQPPQCHPTQPPQCHPTEPPQCHPTLPAQCQTFLQVHCLTVLPALCHPTQPPQCHPTQIPLCHQTQPPACQATFLPQCHTGGGDATILPCCHTSNVAICPVPSIHPCQLPQAAPMAHSQLPVHCLPSAFAGCPPQTPFCPTHHSCPSVQVHCPPPTLHCPTLPPGCPSGVVACPTGIHCPSFAIACPPSLTCPTHQLCPPHTPFCPTSPALCQIATPFCPSVVCPSQFCPSAVVCPSFGGCPSIACTFPEGGGGFGG
jgi:hypothetical protein